MNRPSVEDIPSSDARVDGEVTLLEAFVIVRRRFGMVLAIGALTTIAAAAAAWFTTPIYRAEIVVAPVSAEGAAGPRSQAGIVGRLLGVYSQENSVSEVNHNLAVIESRLFTESFIRKHGMTPALLKGRTKDQPAGSVIEATRAVVSGVLSWALGARRDTSDPAAAIDAKALRRRLAFDVFQKIRSIRRDPQTGLVTLAVEWPDPNRAAEWANAYIKRANAYLRRLRRAELNKGIDFVESKLSETTQTDRRGYLTRLAEEQTRRLIMVEARNEFAFRIIDPAVAPLRPTKPSKVLITVFGALFGLLISLVCVFIAHFFEKPGVDTD